MTNHLKLPQKTPLRQYFSESLILQGFQSAKNRVFSPFLPYFLLVLEMLKTSHITKKRGNSYISCVLET